MDVIFEDVKNLVSEEKTSFDPRIFVLYNLTSGTVSPAYGTVIVLAISFGILAIGALLYNGLQRMATGGYGYSSDSYSYSRYFVIMLYE